MKGFKKAFTIVELVIVIAVIAILAAVLIPTFSNIIRKANISNDTQLVRNLNTALVVDRAVNGEHKTMQSALDAAFDAGYDLAKINARANQNEILWDSKNDVFCYYNDDTKEIEYIPEFPGHDPVGQNEQYLFWKIYSATPEAQKYSIYWNSNSNFTPSLKVGFDAGKSTGVTSLNYVGSGSAQDVVIRTNSFDTNLTINAPLDTVKHYDKVGSLNIIAVASASYHENGQVKFVEISKGRIALEAGSEVTHIHINAKVVENVKQNEFEEIIISKEASVEMPNFSRDDVEIATAGTLVVALQTGTEEVTSQTKLDYVWLTKQGVYEQITVSENNTSAGTTWVNTSNKPAETKTAAQQIANNIGTTATVGEITYDVAVDETTRDIVLKETGTDTVAYTVTIEEGKTVVTTTGENPTTVEVEVVEAQPDKEDVQIGATLFAGGSGTKNNPFLIKTTEHIQNISELYQNLDIVENDANNDYSAYAAYKYADTNIYIFEQPSTKGFYYKVADGVTQLDCSNWTPVDLYGSFDGNNCKFINLDQTFFSTALNYYNYETKESELCEISNCDFDVKVLKTASTAPIVFSAGPKVKFTNVNVSGRVEGQYISSFVGFGVGQFAWKNASYNPAISADYEFVNCHSTATLTCVSIGEGQAAGFFAHIYSGTGSTVKLTNTIYEGRMNVFTNTANGCYINCMGSATITMDEVSASKLKSGTTNQYAEANVHIIAGNKNGTVSGYNAITENAVENASYAIATYMIGTNPGGIQGAYITERIELDGNTFTSVNAHRYDVVIDKTDSYFYKIDGNTIKLGRPDCTGINTNYIIFNQYDSSGNLLSSVMYAFGSTSTIQE